MIQHHFGGGVYAKETRFDAGDVGEKHVHPYDHLSVLVSGIVRLEVDGLAQTVQGPKILTIKAGKTHRVTAITPAIWLCVHATECTDAALVDGEILKGV